MKFPDPNIGYIFGYRSKVTGQEILVTFLWKAVKIRFRLDSIAHAAVELYRGKRISWDVIRWGKCPPGTQALRIVLKKGRFKNHLIVFGDLAMAVRDLKNLGVDVDTV